MSVFPMFEGGGLGLVFVRRDEAVCTVQYHAACTVYSAVGPRGHGARLRSSQYNICFLSERAVKERRKK